MAETYKWMKLNQTVQRLSDGAFIPNDLRNKDWVEFQSFLKAGGIPLDADPPPAPPPDLTQAKAVLKDKTAKTDDRIDALVQILGL